MTRPGPPSDGADRVALTWTSGSAVGETVGRMVRRVLGCAVGVVLSGGGARGFAHIGVLAALGAAGVRVDRVGGCSMGAVMGAFYAAGHRENSLVDIGRRWFVRGKPLSDYTVPRTALLRGHELRGYLQEAFGDEPFETLPLPYFCVSADLVAAESVVHRRGPLWPALLASVSIPGLLPPQASGGRLLVDGGVLNNLPIDVMADDGEGPVVAVDVMRPFAVRSSAPAPRGRGDATALRPAGDGGLVAPPIAEVLARATVLGSWRVAEVNRPRAALTITVPDDGTGQLDWNRLDALVEAGRRAGERALAECAAADVLRPGHGLGGEAC